MVRAKGIVISISISIALASQIATSPPPTSQKSEVSATHKCRLICHPANAVIENAAQSVLDAAWTSAEKLLGAVSESEGQPATLNLYDSLDDYQQADAKLTGGKFKNNWAFAHQKSRTAHVVIQPPCARRVSKTIGLSVMTRHLIAHEVFHLVRYSLIPQDQVLPDWVKDGAASYIDCEVLSQNKWSAGSERDPYSSTYAYVAAQLLKDGKLPKISDIMHSELDALPPTARYGLRWLFFRFLEEGPRPGSGRKLIRKMMQVLRESADSSESQPSEKFEKLENAYIGLDDEFAKFIRGLKPEWDELYRSLDTSGKQWPQLAFPEKNAIAWRTTPVGEDSYELSGHARTLPGKLQQMNLLLGRSDEGFFSVAFVADYGVTIFRFRSGKNEWENLATTKARGIEKGKDFSFRVRVSDGEIKVSVGQKTVLTATSGNYSVRGPWGLCVQAGSAGVWSKIRCTPASQAKAKTKSP